MNQAISVLGVSGMCWVVFRHPTQFTALCFAALRLLCRVCWVSLRARAWAHEFAFTVSKFFFHARTIKPNTLNTPKTIVLKILNLKRFICVGFVWGQSLSVLGSVLGGGAGR